MSGALPGTDRLLGALDDIAMVRDAARGVLAIHWSAREAVAMAESPDQMARIWRMLAQQGWTELGTDDDGSALSLVVALMQELGRASCPAPLMDSFLAHVALAEIQDGDVTELLTGLRAGTRSVAWVFVPDAEDEEAHSPVGLTDSNGLRLTGQASFVENATSVTDFIVVLDAASGRVAIVPQADPGVRIVPAPGLSTPALAELTFDGARPKCIASAAVDLRRLPALARLLLTARAFGATHRGFEMLTDYAGVRSQFGKKIGSYQAIQHKLANLLIVVESSRLALLRAAAAGVASLLADPYPAAVAVAYAARGLRDAVLDIHHGFGGVSFWEDHEMPRHFRRVHGDLVRYGGLHHARRDVASSLLDGNATRAAAGRLPDIDLGPRANAFRTEVRTWLAENWQASHTNVDDSIPVNHRLADQSFSRKLGARGWLSVSWPEQWGGQNRSAMERLVFEEEMAYAEAPIGWHFTSAGMIAPALIKHGSHAQFSDLIASISRGDVCFALGYSEPDHGSDLGGIRTAATRTPNGWSIRGQKIYTSTAGFANYCWLAARTNPDDKRASGISVFVVPLDTPGITIQPLHGLNSHRSNVVFYDDVQLPDSALVGEVNGGWKIITDALAHERIALAAIAARARSYFDQLLSYTLTASRGGAPMARDSQVRDIVAALAVQIEAARLLAVETARLTDAEAIPAHQAAMLKVYASELMERLAETALDVLGSGASLRPGSTASLIAGRFEYAVRDALLYTIGGGTNEIQRTLIATWGLNLPR